MSVINSEFDEEQLNFLTKLKTVPELHFSILGDRVGGDEIAISMLEQMAKDGYIIFDGVDSKITAKGFEKVKDRHYYRG